MASLTLRQAKYSFMDACNYIKTGKHLYKDYSTLKERISYVLYQPKTLTYAEYAGVLAQDLRIDKNEVTFVNEVVNLFKLKTRFNKKGNIELYK
jgi:hypothetical protein